MDPKLKLLIPALVSYITSKGSYVTKTKLLKLLYLIDVEYFRANRTLYTGFSWKFFHLGPWAPEFDSAIQNLTNAGVILETQSSRPDYDVKFFSTDQPYDLWRLFSSHKEELPVRIVLNTWAESSTAEILDHVYFNTEPMEYGVRNTRLDFSTIPEEPIERYKRTTSDIEPKALRKMRDAYRHAVSKIRSGETVHFEFQQPNYDEEFARAMEKLHRADS